jgi:site-specific DNA-methyltransferase (adenine-specific)
MAASCIADWIDSIIEGDARTCLRDLPDASINCIVTSPPYYQQRDYSTPIQIGNEKSPDEYIQSLRAVFSECYRVLRDDGTFWLNLGDKYDDGELLGMPWRVAFALKEDGWILRSDIIWYKPNAVPSSVKNRPTTDHEYVFLFAKSKDYYYDVDAIREPHVTFSPESRMKGGRGHFGKENGTPEQGKYAGSSNLHSGRWDRMFHPLGRNRRTVWEIPLSKYRDAHFAVFPEKLVELCVLAGCPQGGVVLDPFIGSGTTAVVAQRLGRRFVGIDSNPKYCEMAEKRIRQPTLFSALEADALEQGQ